MIGDLLDDGDGLLGTPPVAYAGTMVHADRNALVWTGKLSTDYDGAPRAYAPKGAGLSPLDHLDNAGSPGNWWGIATDTGKPDGKPIIQGPGDPAPGYYVSRTALSDPSRPRGDPRRYVDADQVPFLVIPGDMPKRFPGVKLGDLAYVVNRRNGRSSPAIVADSGPQSTTLVSKGRIIGEGSAALVRALDARGATDGVTVVLFVGSARGWPRPGWQDEARRLYDAWGGSAALSAFPSSAKGGAGAGPLPLGPPGPILALLAAAGGLVLAKGLRARRRAS